MTDAEFDAQAEKREAVVRRACKLMGWEYGNSPVWGGLRKVATGEAVSVSLDKLTQMLDRIEDYRESP